MRPQREYPVGVVYTLATTRTFGTFDDIHSAIQFVVGSPVWTHQLAMKPLWEVVGRHVSAQYPELVAFAVPELSPEITDPDEQRAWGEEQIRRMEAFVGKERLPLTQMPPEEWEPLHPLEGIPDGKPSILIEVDPEAGPEGIKHAAAQIKEILTRPL